jgi:hypothetical protein
MEFRFQPDLFERRSLFLDLPWIASANSGELGSLGLRALPEGTLKKVQD